MILLMKRVAELQEKMGRHAGGFLQEFWKFAAKGNVFDLAVAVILGNAFGAVVNSIVADIFMPLISIATGNIDDLSSFTYTLGERVVISYGHFLQVFVNFLVIAISIFLMFKLVSVTRKRLARKEEEHPETKPEPTEDQKLLTEIRDLLKASASRSERDQ
jgi:large conductance mechanosensitive channel